MITRDDRMFCGLVASSYGLTSRKMPYVMYMLQSIGFELNYRYSIRFGSLRSHGLLNVIGDLTSRGYISQDYSVTKSGYEELETYFVTAEESNIMSKIMEMCLEYTKDELYLICIVDLLIGETLEKGGSEALMNDKESIKVTTKNLCSCYTDEWFNKAVRIMKELRGGIINE